jgi:cytochrome c553
MKKVLISVAALALAGAFGSAVAGDAEAGKAKSAVCAGCHGANGISANPIYPNLAGQQAAYTEAQLKAFKSGERKSGNAAIMAPMAMPLTDADMANLAAYYASLK